MYKLSNIIAQFRTVNVSILK